MSRSCFKPKLNEEMKMNNKYGKGAAPFDTDAAIVIRKTETYDNANNRRTVGVESNTNNAKSRGGEIEMNVENENEAGVSTFQNMSSWFG